LDAKEIYQGAFISAILIYLKILEVRMKRKANLLMTSFVVYILFSGLCIQGYAWEEGGYCGNDPITPNVVYSFIKH